MKLGERMSEIMSLLSVSERSVHNWTKDTREQEKKEMQEKAWGLWLDCYSYRKIGEQIELDHKTVASWCGEFWNKFQNSLPPESRQHFDIWNFSKSNSDSTYFGQMPPQVVENLLWLYTEPGQVVFDPFAGGGW
jgi:hypothetical protein